MFEFSGMKLCLRCVGGVYASPIRAPGGYLQLHGYSIQFDFNGPMFSAEEDLALDMGNVGSCWTVGESKLD